MNAFRDWFYWPMKVDGKSYMTDDQLKSTLAEIWIFGGNFYEAWRVGVDCGRIFEVPN